MATSSLVQESPPRFRQRLLTTSGASGLRERYNYGTIIHNRVFIGGLHSSVTEADLQQKFQEYGQISEIKIIKKPEMEKGYAFITFSEQSDASKLLEKSGSKVKINGLDSKIGPAIRKPSTTDGSNTLASTSPTGVENAEIVMKPQLTPKRSRLPSAPGDMDSPESSPTPIPTPMPGYQPPVSKQAQQTAGNVGSYMANQIMMQQMSSQQKYQDLLLAHLIQASNVNNLNPLLVQALSNQFAQNFLQSSVASPTQPISSPPYQSGGCQQNKDPVFCFPRSPPTYAHQSQPHFNTPVSAQAGSDCQSGNQSFLFPVMQNQIMGGNSGNILQPLAAFGQMGIADSAGVFEGSNLQQHPNHGFSQENQQRAEMEAAFGNQENFGNHQLGMASVEVMGGQGQGQGQMGHQRGMQGLVASPVFMNGSYGGTFQIDLEPTSSPE